MKKIILLGASGNIGEQSLTIIKKRHYALVAFSVGEKTNKIKTIVKNNPNVIAICIKHKNDKLIKQFPKIKFYVGDIGLIQLIKDVNADIVINALVGFVGLAPSLASIKKGVDLALANKESMVVGGELINKALKRSKSHIYPIDSEHSAIYKCLRACERKEVKELILTASGGAFRYLSRKDLTKVTPKEALKHPTWKMGKRVTIDSATMLNKGFEVIEAYYLFKFPLRKIKIIMHPESRVHSIVHLKNGSYLGEVNEPSMLNPIDYALKDQHIPEDVKRVKALEDFKYTFKKFDPIRYPMVDYALKAIKQKGIMPCVLNAVDEVVVDLFLKSMISFLDIEKIVNMSLNRFKNIKHPTYEMLVKIDKEAREWAKSAALLENDL